MTSVQMLFVKKLHSPLSWAIRWALPRSRFAWAQSSHVFVVDGKYVIDSSMGNGVRRQLMEDALKGVTVVADRRFLVPDAEAGLAWARSVVGAPYDLKGALGIALSPYRLWRSPDSWFCYELAANVLVKSGLDLFQPRGYIGEQVLLALKEAV
jgi:hypothetical protein